MGGKFFGMVEINPTMHRGGLAFAVAGLVLVIVGTAMQPWLDYEPSEGQNTPKTLVGLWSYTTDVFEYSWQDEIAPEHAQETAWWSSTWANACRFVPVFDQKHN